MGIIFQQQWLKAMGLLLVGLFYLSEPAEAGKIYTWVDGNGNVNIDDRPPADSSVVKTIIHYRDPSTQITSPEHAALTNQSAEDKRAADLGKRLIRLKERQEQIETIVEENEATIMETEKDAAKYRKRSGAYARRNKKIYERQLVVLKNNLIMYQQDLQYVKEDIAETEQSIHNMGQKQIAGSGNREP
jgi:predicted RNase H-like nuclease (RuvC/YqgF family)